MLQSDGAARTGAAAGSIRHFARLDAALGGVATRVRALRGWPKRVAAFGAGAISATAFAPFYLLPLLAVGYAVMVLLIDGAADGPRPRREAFAAGWFFGLGFHLIGVYWVVFSFFVQADEFAWMAPFVVVGAPAFLALFTGGAAAAAAALWRPGWRRVLVFAVVWMAFEYVRGHALTGFPWNLPGQALAGSAAGAQTAAFIGAYGLGLVATILAAAPAMFADKRRVLPGAGIALGGTALLFAAGALRLSATDPGAHEDIAVRIVQPNIPQREKIDPSLFGRNFIRHVELSRGPSAAGRLYVIWPENAASLLDERVDALEFLSETLPSQSLLLAGAVRRDAGDDGRERYYNSVVVFDPDEGQVVDAYDKHHLVPFGEYLPLHGLLRAIGLAQLAPYDEGFTPGPGPRALAHGGTSFSPLICYEAIFAGEVRPREARPDWLLAVTNDAWFGDTSGPRQHLDQARLRTIETGLPMARSANTGVSALFDARGRLLARAGLYTEGRIDAPLPRALPSTLYTRIGDLGFLLLSLVALGAAAIQPQRARSAS